METGGRAFVTVDVHYLGSGGARAAAVVAADARFCEVVAEHTEDVAEVLPYRLVSSICVNSRRSARS